MKKPLALFVFLSLFFISNGQESNQLIEDIIEQIAESNDEELDYTELYESLYNFTENKINLNKTNKEERSDAREDSGPKRAQTRQTERRERKV